MAAVSCGLLLTLNNTYLHIFLSADKITADTIRFGNTFLYVDYSMYLFLGCVFITRNCVQGIGRSQFVLGAGAAAKLVTLETVSRCMPAGILIGVAVIFFAIQQALLPAFALLLLLGAFGGFFIVPLNALLQERGKHTVGAGNAIAVQNLGENVAMLLMLGFYSMAVKAGIPVVGIGVVFGAIFALAIAALWLWGRRR